MTISIYALFDPREPGVVRYVGKTIRPLNERLWRHLGDLRHNADRSHKRNWLIGLDREGVRPGIRLLEIVADGADWQERERFWIAALSWRLTNGNSGGLGGHIWTQEARQKLREANLGKKASPETIEKLRRSHLGIRPSEESRRKQSEARRGRKMPTGFGAKISAALKGRKMSPEWLAKIAAARRGQKWNDEQRARLKEARKASWAPGGAMRIAMAQRREKKLGLNLD